MEIRRSQKGKDKIFFNGYSYRQGNVNLRTINWRCDHEKCNGSLSTPRLYNSHGVVPRELKAHNHGSSYDNHQPKQETSNNKKRKINELYSETATISSLTTIKCEEIFSDTSNSSMQSISQETSSSSIPLNSTKRLKKEKSSKETVENESECYMTPQMKAQCVTWFIETKSDVQTQRNFKTFIGRKPPSGSTIRELYKMFLETGSVLGELPTTTTNIRPKHILKF